MKEIKKERKEKRKERKKKNINVVVQGLVTHMKDSRNHS